MKKFLRRLHNIWLWFVAIVFTIAGFVAFCVFVGLIVIGIQKLQTAAGKMPPFRVAYESSRSHP